MKIDFGREILHTSWYAEYGYTYLNDSFYESDEKLLSDILDFLKEHDVDDRMKVQDISVKDEQTYVVYCDEFEITINYIDHLDVR